MQNPNTRTRTEMVRLRWLMTALVWIAAAGCTLNVAPADGTGVISGVPTVRIVSPIPNAAYLNGVAVNIQAQIGNAGADIDRVEIAVDNTLVATLPQPNTTGAPSFNIVYTWTAAGEGDHVIAVTAFRGDGSSSAPQTVMISVRAQGAAQPTDPPAPTATTQSGGTTQNTQPTTRPTNTNRPTTTAPTQNTGGSTPNSDSQAAAPAASPTSNAPIATFAQGINVRRGPGTNFDPPIGTFGAGQSTQIIGMNLDGTWFKVLYAGAQAWVYAPLATVTGDISNLPREPGPATPIPTNPPPVVPTSIPATAAPASNVNLVAGIVVLEPSVPRCGETFVVGLDVANLGSQASPASGTVALTDVRVADGSTQGSTTGGYPVLQPGETFRVTMPLTVNTWYNEQHQIRLTIDPQNQIAENNDGDNNQTVTYTLDKANCP